MLGAGRRAKKGKRQGLVASEGYIRKGLRQRNNLTFRLFLVQTPLPCSVGFRIAPNACKVVSKDDIRLGAVSKRPGSSEKPFRTMLLGFRLLGSRDAGKSGSKGFRSFLSGSPPDLFRAYPMSFSSGAAAADLAAKHEQEASKSRRALLGGKKTKLTLFFSSLVCFFSCM